MHSQADLFQVSPVSPSPTPDCSLAGQQSGEFLKRQGMKRAADSREDVLRSARAFARNDASFNGTVTIDHVWLFLKRAGLPDLGNAAGSVFKGPEWEFVEFVKSTRPSNHSRYVRSWRLK